MSYIPNTEQDQNSMLRQIGVGSFSDLVRSVPESLRARSSLNLPEGISELELLREVGVLSKKNFTPADGTSYLGAGSYRHFIPSAVSHLASRSEFCTSYTPYQPEVSQGTLQAIYEFQTYICELTGLDVANASMYDGATALAEAAILATRATERNRVLCSNLVHPHYREVMKTYLIPLGVSLDLIDDAPEGRTDPKRFREKVDSQTACLVVQNPNFFGYLESCAELSALGRENGSLLIQVTTEPISLGVVRSPGESGADIFVGEGQSFGLPVSFGGPLLGLFAVRKEWVRRMPGRLVGKTAGSREEEGYVLTLSTREQHIRRDKATSNICTNQALCALSACVYLALLGRTGLRDLARLNLEKAHYAKKLFSSIPGYSVPYLHPTFNEFVLKVPGSPGQVQSRLREEGILAGPDLSRYYPDLQNHLLFCVTEMISKKEMDETARVLRSVSKS